ncbi:MAG TPA: VOC family protein [Candidatus Margulisiibacteriota bacterium]|nr:VOC family protein [Candidatus Margulisiibacteriota bacterium]
MTTKILGIDHIGIAVRNIEEALRFYTDTLGLSATPVEHNAEHGLRIARVRIGDIDLELIEAQDWERTTQRHLPYKGPGVYHFGLRVADVDAAVAELEHADVPLIDHVPREGDTMRVSFLHPDAANGALIELVMRTVKSAKRQT